MNLKKYIRYSGRYILILFVYLLPFVRNIFSLTSTEKNFATYFILNLGGIYPTKTFDFMSFLFYIIPNIILIYTFSDIMREDCLINYVYVLTRSHKKQKWLFQKALQLFLMVFIAYLLLAPSVFITAHMAGLRLNHLDVGLLSMYVTILFLNIFSLYFFIFLQNYLSLYYGGTQAFLAVVIIYVISIMMTLAFYNSGTIINFILELLVPTNQMYIWHVDCYQVQEAEHYLNNPLFGFKILFSLFLLPLYAILEYWVARYIFLKRDSLEIMKEA